MIVRYSRTTQNADIDTSQAPAWLDLPHKAEYWTCSGEVLQHPWWRRKPNSKPLWIHLFYTKEDAEAAAVRPNPVWVWNGKPAAPRTLVEAMREARQSGAAGVAVVSFQDGEWVKVHKYPADQPVPIELRDDSNGGSGE